MTEHKPVLINEILTQLAWDKPEDICFVDLTLGGGGHSFEFFKAFGLPSKAICIDQDMYAIGRAKERLKEFKDSIDFYHANFRSISQVLEPNSVDRMIVDLGVSSFQLDLAERGFSFQKDGPLDMRMNQEVGLTAADWLNNAPEKEIADVWWRYGEEKRSRALARKWITARMLSRAETTKDFVEAMGHRLDSKDPKGHHPLTKIFQATRIHVNDELGALDELLELIPGLLKVNGRIGIITFHSLEDREVKWGLRGKLKAVNKKVIQATEEERLSNSRSRSAKLRVYEKEVSTSQ